MHQQFALTNQSATLTSFNPRSEQHGDEPTPAADLKFAVAMESALLAMLDPQLRHTLYCKREGVDPDLVNQAHEAPNLRFPKLEPLRWKHEIVGATLTVHHGLGGASDIVIDGCNVNKFSVDPQEGGTVIVGFRVQCKPSEAACGKLCLLIGEGVDITLEPPAAIEEPAPAQDDNPLNTVGNAEAPKRPPNKREAKRAAEAAFADE